MKITGHTKIFAVLGHPIGHTLSPAMHNASFQKLGLDALYIPFDVHPDHLLEVLPAMRQMGFGGVNLTVPLKEVAFRGLKDLDISARRLGAVNTVEFGENDMRGHNTDGEGFLRAIHDAFRLKLSGRKVFILGTGGAGRAVAITCAAENAQEILLSDQDPERVKNVKEEIGAHAPDVAVHGVAPTPKAWADACGKTELIVQATPVGMNPNDPSLLPANVFSKGQKVFDLVYMYEKTNFLRAAGEGGADTANGLDMLLYQGAASYTIWTGKEPDVEAMRQALRTAVYGSSD